MYERVCVKLSINGLYPTIVATLHDIVNCMIDLFFFSFLWFVQSFVRLNWTKVNTLHWSYIVIQVCPHVDTKQNTSSLYRCEFAMCSWHLLFFLCWLSFRCVWHTRRKIAQTHNRKSRKKTPPTTGIFYALCIIVSTSSNTNNTIAILESCENKKKSKNDRSVI